MCGADQFKPVFYRSNVANDFSGEGLMDLVENILPVASAKKRIDFSPSLRADRADCITVDAEGYKKLTQN